MRKIANKLCLGMALWIAVVLAPAAHAQEGAVLDKLYFAVEVNGVVCGYIEVDEKALRKEGKNLIEQETNICYTVHVLGSQVHVATKVKSLLDSATRRTLQCDIGIEQGGTRHSFSLQTSAAEAILKSSLRGDERRIAITPGLLIGEEELFRKVRKEFVDQSATEIRCDVLELVEQEVHAAVFKKIKEEQLELAGKTYSCLVIEQTDARTGVRTTYWLDPGCHYFVKSAVANRVMYVSDRRVVDRVKVANIDDVFFTKTNVSIADVMAIRYMKLKVKIEPTGAILKAIDLNVPGQKFSGTVKGNLVDGIFEIEHVRYDGRGAPTFPPSSRPDPALEKYLKADSFIESDDPLLVKKSREITTGCTDSWQAAVRLSRWVAENIGYAIPGGGTARKTYDLRAGDCGAHSMLLAAFCRAVGVPARVVFGALYVPNSGGGFGQHAWNEIYMGPAGWVAVDSTAGETDFIDSGHIRIMEVQTVGSHRFNGKDIQVLDHRMSTRTGSSTSTDLAPYLGSYVHLVKGRTFTVLEKDGSLFFDVPGRMALPLNRPDERGRWYCALAPRIYLIFSEDGTNEAREIAVHEVAFLPRRGPQSAAGPGIPAELAPYTGKYFYAAVNVELTVLVQDNRLAVYDPHDQTTALFRPTKQAGEWLDDHGFVIISFEMDALGLPTVLKIDKADTFVRGELASAIVETEIATNGLEAGLEKFQALKAARKERVLFSEESFNLLAYRLLNGGKMVEAMAVFKLIVREYPVSSNAWGCLAEAYVKNGHTDQAIDSYKKSLLLNPKNERARMRIKELQGN